MFVCKARCFIVELGSKLSIQRSLTADLVGPRLWVEVEAYRSTCSPKGFPNGRLNACGLRALFSL